MERQMDTLKVLKHPQHKRIQEEDEEVWISSEDLRTEGSSDEETHSRCRTNKKSAKQMKNEAILRNSSQAKAPPPLITSSSDAPSFLINDEEFSKMKSKCEENNLRLQYAGSLGDAGEASGSDFGAMASCSRESDVEALNLENKWRPKRGSLKLPNLIEGDVADHILKEVDTFYTDMMINLHSLKETAIANTEKLTDSDCFEELKVKMSPQYEETMKAIKKLDAEISDTISQYKIERADRLKTENEMCRVISESENLCGKRAQNFLDLCNYLTTEETEATDENNQEESQRHENKKTLELPELKDNKFIQRNIELAKEGIMANYSLTDEEKARLEDLLIDIDDLYTTEEENSSTTNTTNSQKSNSKENISETVSEEIDEEKEEFLLNAYSLSEEDKLKLSEIELRLKEFTKDVESRESTVEINEDTSAFTLEKALKEIDEKLAKLNKELKENIPANVA